MRYGNVVGSRGSVIPLFKAQAETGVLTITDERMTRFWITLDQAVDFVLGCLATMGGGEVFVPKIPSMRVDRHRGGDRARCERRVIGIRPGEKLHEVLVTEDESRHSFELRRPLRDPPGVRACGSCARSRAAPAWRTGFRYSSETNEAWLDVERAARDGRGVARA